MAVRTNGRRKTGKTDRESTLQLTVIEYRGPKLGKKKTLKNEALSPYPLQDAERIAERGYQRLIRAGRPPHFAKEYRKNVIEALTSV